MGLVQNVTVSWSYVGLNIFMASFVSIVIDFFFYLNSD